MQISIYNVQDTPISGGGMGEVYRGWDERGNAVAIKKIRSELTADANLRTLFHKEVHTLKQLEHPSIVKMYASFEEHGNLYLIMEYVEGETIEQYVRRRGRIVESEAVQLFVEILSAASFVHRQGFVHRDIKPSNIIVKPDGRICLIDFGIVKDMKNSTGHTVTQIIGSDGYMSPEQAMPATINHLSDIYSLGCVLYYMLVGDHAIHKQSNDHATKMAIIKSVFPKAQQFNPNLSDHIQ
ncbi:MAG: serine/threonine protein kinase [Dysgonamonadaceae bacterium]|jgi:serine/threonine-protein kinase|nr:serine/threonine protein kinase [Dysgonamonadaceae bacterium]